MRFQRSQTARPETDKDGDNEADYCAENRCVRGADSSSDQSSHETAYRRSSNKYKRIYGHYSAAQGVWNDKLHQRIRSREDGDECALYNRHPDIGP